MREQIRLWFYSQFFMSVVLTGDAPYRKVLTYEKLQDADGVEMHGSWGNLISAEEAFERMGADVMRWQYCQQPPTQNLRFGYKAASEIKRRLLTLWNSVRFLTDYGSIKGFAPMWSDVVDGPPPELPLRPLDVWLLARVQQLVRDAETAYDAYLTVDVAAVVETFVEDLSNWHICRSRRRFYGFDEAAFRTLWTALVQLVRVFAPIMPFLAEHLWQTLVAEPCAEAPDSVFLAGWPDVQERFVDGALLGEIAATRRVTQLGRRARSKAGVKLRQPLRRVYVRGAPHAASHAGEIAEELRVKEVTFDEGPVARAELLPNLPVLGPRLGRKLPALRAALKAGDYEQLDDGDVLVAGERLAPGDVIRAERLELVGWAIAEDDGISVAFDVELDDELRTEGRVHDLVHELNIKRKQQGLMLTDRIAVTLPERDADLIVHGDWIRAEVLAREIAVDGTISAPVIAKL